MQGMRLSDLLNVLARNNFRVEFRYFDRLAYLIGIGVLNSLFGAIDGLVNAKRILRTEIAPPPLFIIGHWRSGTTHLHNLLSQDEQFTSPAAYQCIFPRHFLVTGWMRALFNFLTPAKRPQDNVAFDADVPHEDEFAVASYSTVSPYMRVWFPISGDEPFSELDPLKLPPELLARWQNALSTFLKKVLIERRGRLLLKSPPHTGRIGTLLEMFPGCQFVHILRNPYKVFPSTLNLWRTALQDSHLQTLQLGQLEEMTLAGYTSLFDLYERDKHLIPEGALYEIKFEDLESRPEEILRDLYDKLRLRGFDDFRVKLQEYLLSIRGYEKNVLHADEISREIVRQRWGFNFERYGYPL